MWIRRLDEIGVLDVSWGVFCLEVQNFDKPLDQFDVDRSRSAPVLRTLVAVRDGSAADGADVDGGGQAAAGRFYAAIGTRSFDQEQPIDDPATIEAALTDAGLDPGWHSRAVSDPATWDVVMNEHQALIADTRSFGVPTIRLDGGTGPAIFGPVISNPPTDDTEATELWEHVSWLARYENFSELKRDRTIEPDLASYRTAVARRAAESAT